MALSHLFKAKPRFHLQGFAGFPKPTRWRSSTTYSSSNGENERKRGGAVREQRAIAVELFVKKYMETHGGEFPNASHVQKNVGGSWYTLKDILHNLKERMLGNSPLRSNPVSCISDSRCDSKDSMVFTSHSNLDKSELGEPKSAAMDSTCTDNGNITRATSLRSSENMDNAAASEASRTDSNPHETVPCGPVTVLQSSEAAVESQSIDEIILRAAVGIMGECSVDTIDMSSSGHVKLNNNLHSADLTEAACTSLEAEATFFHKELNISASAASKIMGEELSEDILESGIVLDNSKAIEPDTRHMQPDQKQKLNAEPLSFVNCHEPSNVGLLQEIALNNLDSTGFATGIENKFFDSKQVFPKFSEEGKMPASVDGTPKNTRLSDLFVNISDDHPDVKNGHAQPWEALSSILENCQGDQKSNLMQFSDLNNFTPNVMSGTLQEVGRESPASSGGENLVDGELPISTITPKTGSEIDEVSASSTATLQGAGLEDLYRKTLNDQAAGQLTDPEDDLLAFNQFSEYSNKETGEKSTLRFDVRGLIDCIKELPEQLISRPKGNDISQSTDQVSNKGTFREVHAQFSLPKSRYKGQTIQNGHPFGKQRQEKPAGVTSKVVLQTNFNALDGGGHASVTSWPCEKSKCSPQVSLPSNRNLDATSSNKGADEYKAMVKFLPRASEEADIVNAFKDCGEIVKTEFYGDKRSYFKSACLYFKTREGQLKAFKKTEVLVRNGNVIVETDSPLENTSNKISLPDLIGEPDVPTALVKNPTQTVMIKHLTQDIGSHHIEEALSFCKSSISGFFLGSSSSVAYVEFETEDAKDRALAQHSIKVLGKRLFVFRIDSPRTTVLRISNFKTLEAGKKVQSLCESYGKIRSIYHRSKASIMDVHFRLTEWPNMLNILNRLNGAKVDGQRLIAQPAPVYPPDILQVLLMHPEGRRHVKAILNTLLQKVGEDAVNEAALTDLATKIYGDYD